MGVDLKMEWKVTLVASEFNLILRALGGRLREEEKQLAAELGQELVEKKAKTTEQSLREVQKLITNLEKETI